MNDRFDFSEIFPQNKIIIVLQDIILQMFSCFGKSSRSQKQNPLNKLSHLDRKYLNTITNALNEEQVYILSLIYEDLASQSFNKKLSMEEFLNFFNFKGLWGVKLFELFSEGNSESLSLEQFLYGIAKTAKASLDDKISLIYSFIRDNKQEGIRLKNFSKMLFITSKQDINQLLLEQHLEQQILTSYPILSRGADDAKKRKIIKLELKPRNYLKRRTSFQEVYSTLLTTNQQCTLLEICGSQFQIKYSNMNELIQDFAIKVFRDNGLNIHQDNSLKLSFNSFKSWIKRHPKLLQRYFFGFQQLLWESECKVPKFLTVSPDHRFTGNLFAFSPSSEYGSQKTVYFFQLDSVLFCCQKNEQGFRPFKIICLEGRSFQKVQLEQRAVRILSQNSNKSQNSQDHHIDIFVKENNLFQKWWTDLQSISQNNFNFKYEIKSIIGNGRYSNVYKCIDKKSGQVYACKVIDLQKLSQRARKAISHETEILEILQHKQIVKYFQTIVSRKLRYIITENIQGEDLFTYVKNRNYLNEFESAFIIGHVIKTVNYLHSLDIVHRDLKPQNIIVSFQERKQEEIFQCTTPFIRQGQRIENVKIIDFGLANYLDSLQKMQKNEKVSGTPNYIAPQLLLGEEVSVQSDVFSIGAILYFLLRGRLPFAAPSAQKTLLKTVRGQFDMQSEHWTHVSEQAKDLLLGLLEVDPKQRITLQQAANHVWFKETFSKVKESHLKRSCRTPISVELEPQSKNRNFGVNKNCISIQNINLQEYQNKRRQSMSSYLHTLSTNCQL